MPPIAVARNAMATRFEIVLHGDNPVGLRAAGEEALAEIERLEAQLSLYRPTSEISGINARAANGPVRVEPRLFRLLQHAQRLSAETGGAFDITVAPLVRCWGFMGGTGQVPEPSAVAEARERTGMDKVILDERNFTVQFAREGVMIDLGSIGKGYALEQAADLLREAGITSAILHGGASTVCAIGSPPDTDAWKIVIEHPEYSLQRAAGVRPKVTKEKQVLAIIALKDESLSVSAVWGKSFAAGGRTYGHVIDPRTGEPAARAVLAAVALPSATESDAFSTGLLTLGLEGHDIIAGKRDGMRSLVVTEDAGRGGYSWMSKGIETAGS